MKQEAVTYTLPEYVELVQLSSSRAIVDLPTQQKEVTGSVVPLLSEIESPLRTGASAESLAGDCSVAASDLRAVLNELTAAGILCQSDADEDPTAWLTGGSQSVSDALADTSVCVFDTRTQGLAGLPDAVSEQVVSQFSNLELELNQETDLVIAITDGASPNIHTAILEAAYDADCPYLPARIVGSEILIGPLSCHGETACYSCYRTRRLASDEHSHVREVVESRRAQSGRGPAYPEVAWRLLESHVVQEVIAQLLPQSTPVTHGSIVRISIQQLASRSTDVLRIPGCSACAQN